MDILRSRRIDHAQYFMGGIQTVDVGEVQCLCGLHEYLEFPWLCRVGSAGDYCFKDEGCSRSRMAGPCSEK